MGAQNSGDAPVQRLEERAKSATMSKRVRSSLTADARLEGRLDVSTRQGPLLDTEKNPPLEKEKSSVRNVSATSGFSEDKLRGLAPGGEGWEKKMERKRPVGTMLNRGSDVDRDVKPSAQHRSNSEVHGCSSDALPFRHGASAGASGGSKMDGSSQQTSSGSRYLQKTEMDSPSRSGSMIPVQETRRHHSTGSRRRGPHRPWSDGLPSDILGVIVLKLPCRADRVYFSAVCRLWRSATRGLDAPLRQLPWLLLPSPAVPSFFSLHSGATRPLYLLEKVRGANLCGSHDGGWVALAFDQWREYAAVNLLSGVTVSLPDRLRTNLPNLQLHGINACEHPMVIHTVTFSDVPSKERCLAAAHVSSAFNLAFWRPGMDRHWIAYGPPVDVIEDIIYYSNELKEGFHVLSNTEDVVVYSPNGGGPSTPLVMSRSSYQVQKRADYKPGTGKLSRYLVESRGKLLMVLRQLKVLPKPKRLRTFGFRIFEMNLGIAGSQVSWLELHTLPGWLLLLGRGCSRAFEVSHFNNNRPQLGYSICYLDDTGLALNSGGIADMGAYVDKRFNHKDRIWRFPHRFTSQCPPPIWFAP